MLTNEQLKELKVGVKSVAGISLLSYKDGKDLIALIDEKIAAMSPLDDMCKSIHDDSAISKEGRAKAKELSALRAALARTSTDDSTDDSTVSTAPVDGEVEKLIKKYESKLSGIEYMRKEIKGWHVSNDQKAFQIKYQDELEREYAIIIRSLRAYQPAGEVQPLIEWLDREIQYAHDAFQPADPALSAIRSILRQMKGEPK